MEDTDRKEKKNSAGLHIVKGVPLPPFIGQKRIDEYKNWPLLQDDVYIVAFPKSGTTWTQQIVKLIKNNGVDDDVVIEKSIPWVDERGPEEYKDMQSPRFFKSHMPYKLMVGEEPAKSPAKYIYVARNPKDVAVSMYHNAKVFKINETDVQFDGPWDAFFEEFLVGNVPMGSWFDHVLEWWEHKDAANILFLKYEDRKKDLRQAIESIVSFLGYKLEPQVVDSIAQQCTFQSMKKNPAANWSWNYERHIAEFEFMRKGIVGDWKNYFTEDQNKRLNDEFTRRMAGTGLDFEFEQ